MVNGATSRVKSRRGAFLRPPRLGVGGGALHLSKARAKPPASNSRTASSATMGGGHAVLDHPRGEYALSQARGDQNAPAGHHSGTDGRARAPAGDDHALRRGPGAAGGWPSTPRPPPAPPP